MKRQLIPVPQSLDREECNELFPELRKSVDWVVQAGFKNKRLTDQDHISEYRGGRRWGTRQYAKHIAQICSFGFLTNSGNLSVKIGQFQRTLMAPTGTKWGYDLYGFKLFLAESRRDDYHLSGREFWRFNAEKILLKLIENRNNRIKLETEQKAFLADAQDVFVCAKDSLRTGNCLQGTLRYAEKHQLNIKLHYKATQLLNYTNGDYNPVKLAISAAILRNKAEKERGFALLEEHLTDD